MAATVLSNYLKRGFEKIAYLLFLISESIGIVTIYFLIVISWMIRNKNPKGGIIFFPYGQEGNIGYAIRIREFIPFLRKDSISFHICGVSSDERIAHQLKKGRIYRYLLFQKILWTRIGQVLKARNYKIAFIQRGLCPFYLGLNEPHLEKLLRRLNSNITVDFWDADWVHNESLVRRTVEYVDKISYVHEGICNYYSFAKARKFFFPIGINLKNYTRKEDYSINIQNIRLFFTGSLWNLKKFHSNILPVLQELSDKFNVTLVVVSPSELEFEGVRTEFYRFEENSFFNIMSSCDIGLYSSDINETSINSMAMKLLDYMASGLPAVSIPAGLTKEALDSNCVLTAVTKKEWILALEGLIHSIQLRERNGRQGRMLIERFHSIDINYKRFIEIVES